MAIEENIWSTLFIKQSKKLRFLPKSAKSYQHRIGYIAIHNQAGLNNSTTNKKTMLHHV